MVVAVLLLSCAMAACALSAAEASASTVRAHPSARSAIRSVVALGDSVPRGTNCDCTPYPPLTASKLAATTGQHVETANDSVAGATTASVLEQLDGRGVITHLRRAGVVEIEIGANDVAYSSSCGTRIACYEPRVPTIQKNLTAIVSRVRSITGRRRPLIVLLDYWSVWLGGKYAAAKGDAYVNAADSMTDKVNAVIKSTASESGSAYVDLRAAFKGPSYTYDETHYLSSDGDHPNKAGHEKIAMATEAVIERALDI